MLAVSIISNQTVTNVNLVFLLSNKILSWPKVRKNLVPATKLNVTLEISKMRSRTTNDILKINILNSWLKKSKDSRSNLLINVIGLKHNFSLTRT